MTAEILATTASQFCNIMERIWDGDLHHLYDEFENAYDVARANVDAGTAIYLWPSTNDGGYKGGKLFAFEDGSRVWVRRGECQVRHMKKRGRLKKTA